MKTILPWIVAVLALGGAFFFYNADQTKAAALTKLSAEVSELQTVRTENAELKGQQVPADELVRLRKNTEDLLRLRNEVRLLRDDKTQLTKQTQTAQSEIQRVQAQAQAAQAQAQSLATNLQALSAQQVALAAQVSGKQQANAVINACINNLRQIDGAMQQWALENRKNEQAIPTAQDIAPYMKGNAIPKCPAGGTYTFNSLVTAPTCSIPGHVMPPVQ